MNQQPPATNVEHTSCAAGSASEVGRNEETTVDAAPVRSIPANLPTADYTTQRRAETTLDRLSALVDLLAAEEDYAMPGLGFELPVGFRLSVVVPVYNEEATLHQILARVRSLPVPLEIIVVDDASTDATPRLLAELAGAADLRILSKPVNEGKGAAVRDGLAAAAGDVVIVQDADLEYDPRDILRLLEPLLAGEADVVYGSRYLESRHENSSLLHRIGNGVLTRASNLTTGLRLTDMETCYKAFRREVIQDIEIRQCRFGFEPEITAKIARRGLRVRELPISYAAREWDEGKKIGWRDGVNALWCILRYGWRD